MREGRLYIDYHEGHCCGVRHVSGFYPTEYEKDYIEALQKIIKKKGLLYEITLTDWQLKSLPNLTEYLRSEEGRTHWRLVSRFRNGNTGNYVNVFHYSATPKSNSPIEGE